MDWIKLAQNNVQWRAVVNAVISRQVAQGRAGPARGIRVLMAHSATRTADKLQHSTAQRITHVGRDCNGLTETFQLTRNQTDTDSSSVFWVEGGGIFLRSAVTQVPDHTMSEHRT